MKLLLPTDFSESSLSVLDFALHLTQLLDGELHIIHVYKVTQSASSSVASLEDVVRISREKEMKEVMEKVAANPHSEGITIKTGVYKGYPDQLLLRYAKKTEIDMLVLPTRGLSNLKNIIIGSVANKIVKKASLPVLVMPVDNGPYTLGGNYLLALDNQPYEDVEVFAVLKKILEVAQQKIKIYHAQKDDELMPIDPFVHDYLSDYVDEIVLEEGNDPVQNIKSYVSDNQVSFLVMVKRHHSAVKRLFFKGHTEEEYLKTNVPLLILTDGEK